MKSNGPLRGAINDTKSWVSSFASAAAIGGQMQPGPADRTIDLVRTILQAEMDPVQPDRGADHILFVDQMPVVLVPGVEKIPGGQLT